MNVRKIWIGLVLVGVVPALLFHVLKGLGATAVLHYVSTTIWLPPNPTLLQAVLLPLKIALMFVCLITWSWVKVFIYLFIGAALPFMAADACLAVTGAIRCLTWQNRQPGKTGVPL